MSESTPVPEAAPEAAQLPVWEMYCCKCRKFQPCEYKDGTSAMCTRHTDPHPVRVDSRACGHVIRRGKYTYRCGMSRDGNRRARYQDEVPEKAEDDQESSPEYEDDPDDDDSKADEEGETDQDEEEVQTALPVTEFNNFMPADLTVEEAWDMYQQVCVSSASELKQAQDTCRTLQRELQDVREYYSAKLHESAKRAEEARVANVHMKEALDSLKKDYYEAKQKALVDLFVAPFDRMIAAEKRAVEAEKKANTRMNDAESRAKLVEEWASVRVLDALKRVRDAQSR